MSRLDAALDETERRLAAMDTTKWAVLAQRIADDCHPEQRDFVLDPGRHLAALCNRGAGKTIGGMARFIRRMLLTPKADCYYLAKTRDHAERLMWQPIKAAFKALGFREGVDIVYNETKLRAHLPRNGATLQLFGADKPGYIEALRGRSYHEVGIDEASVHPDKILVILRHEIIGPRLLGAFWLAGTPGRRLKGLFYEVTRRGSTLGRLWKDRDAHPNWKGWSVHKWSVASAVEATKHRPIEALIELLRVQQEEAAGMSPDNPVRRRELDGEWAADETVNVYQYRIHHPETGELWNQWDPERIGPLKIAKLPDGFDDWCHVISIDPGYSDPTAINVFAFALSDPTRTVYHRLCFERKEMYARPIAHVLIGSDLNHGAPGGIIGAIGEWPTGMVADPAHQMAQAVLAELREVYSIHIEPAKKGFGYKVGAIEVVNGELIDGRIKVLKDSELEAQLLDLQWDESHTGELIERRGQPNHSSDTLVYARAMIANFMSAGGAERADTKPDPTSPDYAPPMPDVAPDDFNALFQDDYGALLG